MSITIGELIAELQKHDPGLIVVIEDTATGEYLEDFTLQKYAIFSDVCRKGKRYKEPHLAHQRLLISKDSKSKETDSPKITLDEQFENDLLSIFGERIKSDLGFCYRLYGSLGNVNWFKEEDKYKEDDLASHVWSTFRGWAGWIAKLRGLGERYTHFYCSAQEGWVDKEIAEKMAEKGWKFKELDRGV